MRMRTHIRTIAGTQPGIGGRHADADGDYFERDDRQRRNSCTIRGESRGRSAIADLVIRCAGAVVAKAKARSGRSFAKSGKNPDDLVC